MNQTNPSLCETYRDYFYIGAAVNESTIRTHDELIRKHFNSITAQNSMKFRILHPKEGTWDFTLADELVSYAKERGLKMRGHTLVWHNRMPAWVFESGGKPASRGLLLGRMEEHIKTVMEHFPDVYAWDVVNEALQEEAGGYLRASEWRDLVGEDFVEQAFLFAGKHVKNNAKLYYNDYDEHDPDKCAKICRLVKELKEKGAPVGGLGLQSHHNMYIVKPDQVRRAMEQYVKLGVTLQITELDVAAFDRRTREPLGEPTGEMRKMQEEFYANLFQIYREYREAIECVSFWGVADDATWLDHWPIEGRKNEPLLFDENHNPKPAFERVVSF